MGRRSMDDMTVFYVDSSGSNVAPYDSWEKAAHKLHSAISIANDGDTIQVESLHSEFSSEKFIFDHGINVICVDRVSGRIMPMAGHIETAACNNVWESHRFTVLVGLNIHYTPPAMTTFRGPFEIHHCLIEPRAELRLTNKQRVDQRKMIE